MAQKKATKSKAKRKRTTAAKSKAAKRPAGGSRKPRAGGPSAATTLTRRFKGADHVVKVTGDGFEYAGTTYRSLTQIAKVITHYPSVSGPRFFGTDEASKTKGGAK